MGPSGPTGATGSDYDATIYIQGLPFPEELVIRFPLAHDTTFPANFAGSYGVAVTAATASTDFDIQKNDSSVGTATFGVGDDTATFVSVGGLAIAASAGDIISLIAPTVPDDTLANVGFVITGTRT